MKNVLFFLAAFSTCTAIAQSNSVSSMSHNEHKFVNTNDFKWMDGPPGLPPGAKFVVLDGDPSKESLFTIRATMPAGYKIPAHWHPTVENVTVLEGNLYMGMGEKLDELKATALTAGGFTSLPQKQGIMLLQRMEPPYKYTQWVHLPLLTITHQTIQELNK